MNVIDAAALGKRYGSTWALRECTLTAPEGYVTALVGPNGAGKTTLMNLAVGLTEPTAGTIRVLGGTRPGSRAALDGIAFVAQDAPLYKNLSVADMLHLTRNLNRHFDHGYAEERLGDLGIPLKRKAGKLSGGQQAQLALTLALARRPRLLVLDEPVATLDPLARHDFLETVVAAAADDGMSVVLSSHLLTDVERVANDLILVSGGRPQVADEVAQILANHRLMSGPAASGHEFAEQLHVVYGWRSDGKQQLLVRAAEPTAPLPPGWEERPVTLEELALSYLREPGHQPSETTR